MYHRGNKLSWGCWPLVRSYIFHSLHYLMQRREAHLLSSRDALSQPVERNATPGRSLLASEQLHNIKPLVWGLEEAELYQLPTSTPITLLSVWPEQPAAVNWGKMLRKAAWAFLPVQLTLHMQLQCWCFPLMLSQTTGTALHLYFNSHPNSLSCTGAFSGNHAASHSK